MRKSAFLLSVLLASLAGYSQSVTGSWYGRADVNSSAGSNNYLTELILKQKGDEVEGVFGYYFKDSYQSFFVRGTYDKNTREVIIRNLPMLYYKGSTINGIECPMNFKGILLVSAVSSSLKGSFYSDDKYKYTCPELRVNFAIDQSETSTDSALKSMVVGKKIWKPQQEDFIVTDAVNEKPVTINADAVNNSAALKLKAAEEKKLVEKLEKRSNIYSKDIEIIGDSVRLSFYDNGDIDGDIISVFLNKSPVLTRQELTARALNIYLALDSTREFNEISMLAENLGKYPPNTALLVVSDGINRHEIYLSSSLTQNAVIRIRKKK